MILKVRAVAKESYDWLILGGVRDVLYSGDPCKDCEGLKEGDYVLFNRVSDEEKTDPEKGRAYKKMEVRYKDSGSCNVWFNDVAYLMNDEGKTVETIYGF